MNDQSHNSQFKAFDAPPSAPSGLQHLTPWMKVLAGGGIAAAVTFYALQVALPESWRPSSVAGDAAGDTVRHEIEGMKAAKIDMERRIADATAQANAKAQADLIAINKAAEERTASLAPVSAMAGLADVFCLGAKIVSGMTQPQGVSQSSSDDFYYAAQKTGAATCGMGSEIRQEVTRSQIDAVREAAAARGMSMNNGAEAPSQEGASDSDEVKLLGLHAEHGPPRLHKLADVFAITTASQHYSEEEVSRVMDFGQDNLDPAFNKRLLDENTPRVAGWDVYVDRIRAVVDLAHRV